MENTPTLRNEDDRRFAQTLARGIQVLKAFKTTDGPLGNQELSERTNIPKPTISRLTFTLSQLGFLEHLQSYGKYRLGPAAIALGSVANATIPFIDNAAELMQPLSNEVGAMVALAMRDGDRMLLTHCWRPENTPSIWLDVGFRLPLVGTGSGLTYLASLEKQKALTLVDEISNHPNADRETLIADIKESRNDLIACGFVTSIGRWNPNVVSVSAPFRTRSFSEPLVFLCGAPAKTVTEEIMVEIIGPKLAGFVRKLDMLSGGSSRH